MSQQHELLTSGPAVDPNIYQAIVLSSGAALTLVIWDALLTLGDEVDCIWSGSCRAHIKWIYLLSRWFGLLNQMSDSFFRKFTLHVNFILIFSGIEIWHYLLAAYAPIPMSTCEAYFLFGAATFQFLQLCLDVVLILRIWAVYQRHRRYVAIALAVVFFETLMGVMTQAIPTPKSTVDGTCIILHTPPTVTCLGIGMIVSQIVLLCLTCRGKALLQPAARRSKLITVVVRDGMLVFGLVIGMVMMIFLYLVFNQVVINVLLPWLPVVPSILTPRIILNMQMAAEPTEPILELTTDLGTMPDNEIQLSTVHGTAVIYERPMDAS
ncbi:hypothetical protein OG21DRAFT_793384 [Imleria badia]|nr:hypothetical protein OG21DRAFT_793384 [Imleria badia]